MVSIVYLIPSHYFSWLQFMLGIIIALNSNQLMRLSFSDIDFHRRIFAFSAMLSNFPTETFELSGAQLNLVNHEMVGLIDALTFVRISVITV